VPTNAAEQLSLAPTEKVTGAAQVPAIAFTLMLAGQLITGGVLSITVIVCDALVWLFEASVAVNVRVITKGLAGEPAPPLFDSETVIAGAGQLSEAVAWDGFAAGT
jgi:hypothetical protein